VTLLFWQLIYSVLWSFFFIKRAHDFVIGVDCYDSKPKVFDHGHLKNGDTAIIVIRKISEEDLTQAFVRLFLGLNVLQITSKEFL
jgi:hypothetical protein